MIWNIIGHDWAASLLQKHITDSSLRHAYLITGPPGIGKTKLAVRFAQALNCPSPRSAGVPCLTCHSCQRIARFEHPDLFPVRTADDSSQIRIDQIRKLIHDLSLVPYEAAYRIGLLIEFEQANQESQNALLKTLEEPGKQVVLILTSNSADSLLETITSRCEEIQLQPLSINSVANGLQQIYGVPAAEAEHLAHISGGRPETAYQFHQDPDAQESRLQVLNDLKTVLSSSIVSRFQFVQRIEKDAQYIENMLQIWSSFWHDVLIKAGRSSAPTQNIDQVELIESVSHSISLQEAHQILASLEKTALLLDQNANSRLTLENLLLQLPRI